MVIMYKWNMTVLKANSSKLHVSRCLTAGLRFNWIDLILTPVLTPPPPSPRPCPSRAAGRLVFSSCRPVVAPPHPGNGLCPPASPLCLRAQCVAVLPLLMFGSPRRAVVAPPQPGNCIRAP
jgi:hypothetical protein